MTVYVDNMRMHATVANLTAEWSHMFSDKSITELDEMAEKLGLKPRWIQDSHGFIHYDVVEAKRQRAIKLGAVEIEWRDLPMILARCTYMSLRIPHNLLEQDLKDRAAPKLR